MLTIVEESVNCLIFFVQKKLNLGKNKEGTIILNYCVSTDSWIQHLFMSRVITSDAVSQFYFCQILKEIKLIDRTVR